ncbi:MAG: hypothetical protein PWQ56_320 [Patescibacteria group bacterium]|nr:hypothetical protein [Patescibacteria group bacterium]
MKKRTIIFLIILIAAGVFAYLSWQNMSFSKEVLRIEILAPEKTNVGEEIEYIVKFKNNGNIRLENPELIFEYPESSVISNGGQIKTMSSSELGGDIYPGEERVFKFSAVLLGKERDVRIAKASISFQPKDLKTRSEVSTTFTTILGETPINISIEAPSKVGTGKALSLRVDYSSNVDYPLTDLTCYVTYPSGFDFLYSQPRGIDNTQFDIALLGGASSGRIDISGILNGEASEQKVFKAKIGIWQNGNFILLKEVIKGVEISSPSIYLTQRVNNNSDYAASPGEKLHYEIIFQNIGDQELKDLALITRVDNRYVDMESIEAEGATIEDGSIIWEAKDISELSSLEIGQIGKVEFWVNALEEIKVDGLENKNPTIKNTVTIGETRQDFLTRIESDIGIAQKFYTDNKYFENSGPYPLQTGEKTYLTIEWSATSTLNDVDNAKIVTALPESITFENKTYAQEGSEIIYNEETSEVICNIGSIPAGSGTVKEPKVCAFQVSIQPELADEVIILLGAAQLSGTDQWTGKTLTAKTDILYAQMSF